MCLGGEAGAGQRPSKAARLVGGLIRSKIGAVAIVLARIDVFQWARGLGSRFLLAEENTLYKYCNSFSYPVFFV